MEFTPNTYQHHDRLLKGVLFGLCAYMCFVLTNACAKSLAQSHHVVELVFYRNLIVFIPLAIFVIGFKKFDLLKTNKPVAVITRATMATATLGVTFTAYKILPLADATVLLFAASLLLPVLGSVFLKEQVGPYRWGAIFVGFSGVAYMAQPSGDVVVFGIIAGLIAATMQAIMMTIARYIKTENPLTSLIYLISIGTILPLFAMPFFWQPVAQNEILILIGMGLTGGMAQLCVVNAFKYAPAAIVSTLNYTGIIWASGLDILVWKVMPANNVLIGAAIIVAANLFILYRERKLSVLKKAGARE